MAIRIDTPGAARLELKHLLLDVNGTVTDRGGLIEGVAERLEALREAVSVRLVSADTFGTLADIAQALGVDHVHAQMGADKLALVDELGAASCAVIGNGANDAQALHAAGLGIAVLGPEGASGAALAAADVVCLSIVDALDLLLDERVLVATLRR